MTSPLKRPSRMRQLFLFLTVAIAVSPAQVPKPPWAGGAAPVKKSGASATTPDASQNPDSTIKVDVKLVNVFVTVTDDHGAPVGGLTKENFETPECKGLYNPEAQAARPVSSFKLPEFKKK